MRYLTSICLAILFAPLLTLGADAQTLTSHQDLDWGSPYRWVHIDNIDAHKASLFEGCRKTWLTNLRQGDHLLGDGRPLFWYAKGYSVQTYFTLYPFRTWSDMDARGKMATETMKAVGDAKAKAYDVGDSALIPPHGSQIWRRNTDSDIAWAGTDSLTDLTANVGRLEVRDIDWWHEEEVSKLWDEFQATLKKAKYPLACRMYSNVYGGNQLEHILLWLAHDSAQYQSAPSLQAALTGTLGKERTIEMLANFDRYFPVVKSYEIEKRVDLSNLGK